MLSFIYRTIGNLLGEDRKIVEEDNDFESGFFLDIGIQWVYVCVKFYFSPTLKYQNEWCFRNLENY